MRDYWLEHPTRKSSTPAASQLAGVHEAAASKALHQQVEQELHSAAAARSAHAPADSAAHSGVLCAVSLSLLFERT